MAAANLRFGDHWRVLLSQLILFGYAYPGHRTLVPGWVMDQLLSRLRDDSGRAADDEARLCRGTLLHFEDFRVAVERWGYLDARILPETSPTPLAARQMAEPSASAGDAVTGAAAS